MGDSTLPPPDYRLEEDQHSHLVRWQLTKGFESQVFTLRRRMPRPSKRDLLVLQEVLGITLSSK
jgi:hypothetical protein